MQIPFSREHAFGGRVGEAIAILAAVIAVALSGYVITKAEEEYEAPALKPHR